MPKPQESFAPYWTAEPGWETELQLRNNLASGALTVTPVLRLANGNEIPLDPVTISSNAAASIQVGEALLRRAPSLLNKPGTFGSVAFRYTSLHARNLAAVAAVHMHAQPIGYHVDAFPVSHGASGGSLEGIWWQPRPGVKNVVVISNSSDKTIGGTLSLSDSGGKQSHQRWSLTAHQTKRMNVDELVRKAGLSGNYGGIAFASPSFAPALDGIHFLYDETAGFSALMNMFDRDPAAKLEERTWAGNKQWTMWAPMLALQTPDPAAGFPGGTVLEPIIFLRNATAKKVSASITLTWRGDSTKGRVKLPEVSLKPFETRQLEIGPMQNRLGIPEDAHWALVTLTSPASPDDLLGVAASYDSTGRYGAQTPFSDNLGAYWAGGQWQVDATHNAIVAVTNGGTRATEARLTLHFDDGRKNYEVQQTIQPGEQMWLNFADLIHHSVPDRKGNVLPAEVIAGTYDLEDLNPGLGGNLIEGKVALDKTWGHLTYGCLTCCGYAPYLSPDPGNVVVNGLLQIDTFGTNNCTGQKGYDLTGYYQSTGVWWSGNSAIAQVTAFQGKGMAPGTTTGYGKAVIPNGDGGRPKPPCPQLDQLAGNQIPVVSVSIIQHTSQTTSSGDTAAAEYKSITGTSSLGIRTGTQTGFKACFAGMEFAGTVSPSTYTGSLELRRTLLSCGTFQQGNVSVSCGATPRDDTSSSALRDDDPQPGGVIYDLDPPGVENGDSFQSVYRYRANFSEYATLADGTTVASANPVNYYVRLSCKFDANGNPSLDTTVSGDNQVGSGTTKTTWNLQ